jgi:DNA-binding response OmpR family regulator
MSFDEADSPFGPMLLLVDDEQLILEMLVEAVEEAGFTTITSGDAADAIALFEQNGAAIRGLVTDVNLGSGLDGWELARVARENSPDLPVVYISGASGHEWSALGVPNSLMITKPFAPAQVVVAVSSLLVASDSAS